jgi:predicted RNA-binding protein
MCLSKLYLVINGQRNEIMRDVSRLKASGDGFVVTDLFGRSEYVPGRIQYLDLVEEHIVVLEKI